MIMNTVNIPFPIIYLAYGAEGLFAATLFFIPSTILLWTVGVFIVAGNHWKENVLEMLRLPTIYAILLGLLLNLLRIQIPELIIKSLDFIALMAIPLVLIILGFNLSKARISSFTTTLLASFIRVGIGFTLGLFMVSLLNITDVSRAVVVLDSAMPAAVMTSLLATKYESEADLVSSVVFLTTIMSLVSIPFILYLLQS
ncbi:AEC family transporter [Chloroflexota bacterium]